MQKIVKSLIIFIFVFILGVFFVSLNRSSNYDTEYLIGNKLEIINFKSFKDDKIEITKILDEDYNDFSKNDTIENNDHFVNLNSLFLNSGFKIVIKKNNNIKIRISNIITDDPIPNNSCDM